VLVTASTTEPVTALTFDDGPHPDTTPALLEVLARHGARATFFLIGERASAHPDLVAAIVAGGHDLGNHLMRDRPSVRLPAGMFRAELTATGEILARHGEVRWWRPGSGFFTPRMVRDARSQGLRGALGSPWLLATTYAGDSRQRGTRLARRAHPGAIAVFHEGTPVRAAVGRLTDGYLDVLAQRGLSAITLGDLARCG
jgi:peptidoglycan/xylan/chitin deacetylase (PgdA/CDA1 family)